MKYFRIFSILISTFMTKNDLYIYEYISKILFI